MEQYSDATYGERIAEIYDELYPTIDENTLDVLTDLAKKGRVLELGIGTGRVALPLKDRGLEMFGIDASEAMVSKLRKKEDGEEIPVKIGDFSEIRFDKTFNLIFVVFNTFYGLLSQEQQINCFKSVASQLEQEGVFLLEVFVPDLTRFHKGQTVRVVNQDMERVQLNVSQHDPIEQHVMSTHVHLTKEGVELYPVKLRYVWPAELDLMGKLAGMQLLHRWSDWDRSTFTAESYRHISVYGVTR